MARINKQEVLHEMQEGLRLDVVREKTPDELADKVLPVFKVNPSPRIIQILDTVANDSDKTITVPSGKKWKVLWGFANLVTTATVGDRRISIRFGDGSNDLWLIDALNVQTASTNENYNFAQNFTDVLEAVGARHTIPIPKDLTLIEGFTIRVLDAGAIAATADDLILRFIVEESDMNSMR